MSKSEYLFENIDFLNTISSELLEYGSEALLLSRSDVNSANMNVYKYESRFMPPTHTGFLEVDPGLQSYRVQY